MTLSELSVIFLGNQISPVCSPSRTKLSVAGFLLAAAARAGI